MITISGAAKLTFTLPTDIDTAFAYFADLRRVIGFLPRIQFVEAFDDNFLRLCYANRELNAYDIRIYCDAVTHIDYANYAIRIAPQEGPKPIKPKAGLQSASTMGVYQSVSYFFAEGEQTRLEYHIELAADLPKPWALTMVPDTFMNSIAGNISRHRIHEIADGFIERSLADLPGWIEERGVSDED